MLKSHYLCRIATSTQEAVWRMGVIPTLASDRMQNSVIGAELLKAVDGLQRNHFPVSVARIQVLGWSESFSQWPGGNDAHASGSAHPREMVLFRRSHRVSR